MTQPLAYAGAMQRTSFAGFHCSLAQSLEVMGEWWTPLILRDLWLGVDTFDELTADLGLSRNLLTARLRDLVDHGLVARTPYGPRPDRFRYGLTEAGRDLVPILAALTAWGDRWTTPPAGQPLAFAHQGHPCTPMVACRQCGAAIEPDELSPVAGPGARAVRGTAVVASRPLPHPRRPADAPGPTGSAADSVNAPPVRPEER